MKKNKMSRLASALLILVLLTTSIVGSTFAKYTTEGSASDTARVAKWGVTINTSGSLYSDAYANKNATDGNLPAAWETASPKVDEITVAAPAAEDNIVAPGTKSAGGLSFSISGKPEVAVNVSTTITAEDIYLKAGTYGVLVEEAVTDDASFKRAMADNAAAGVYKLNGTAYEKVAADATYSPGQYYVLTNEVTVVDDYFPVKYKLEGGTTYTDKKAVEVANKLANAIDPTVTEPANTVYKVEYSNISHAYPANTDLGAAGGSGPHFGDEKLSWEWEFENADETIKAKNNAADTILGNLIAAKKDTTVKYKVVSVGADKATALTIGTGDTDFTVSDVTGVVANLQTKFDITLTVTQVD